ncbi:efflux RND transporter periplasmic adaptor subunit [Limibacter armeniacum]|uniref:efflux RND transporter periplasmic adaptor subunit n=1 Tax=Limibacter armeniacum TaxID=466084 RepID=UPI002FE69ECD
MRTDIKTSITIGTVTLLIGLLLGWLIFGGSNETNHDHSTANKEKGQVWTCSMHPQIRQSEPGDCPICGMELIPLSESEGHEDPMAINMSPTAMQLANVQTAMVGNTAPDKTVRLNGKVQADERMVYSQTSHMPGRIERLMINFTGEKVNRGKPIAYIYSPELVTAQQELFEAQKIKDSQPQLFKAAKEKLKNWKLTDRQIDRILSLGKPETSFPVLSDYSGYVMEKKINAGDHIMEGAVLYEIANLSRVWVLLDVYESDLPWVKKGDKVSFVVASLPGKSFEGTIDYIDPIIDAKTRVAQARTSIPNPNQELKPEMFVTGTVSAKIRQENEAISIPKTAVMWTGKRSVVYVKTTSDKGIAFQMRTVTLGPSLGENYLVKEGLKNGEEIAVSGTFSIDAAAQLAGKPSMMMPEGGQPMTGHDHGGKMDLKPEDEIVPLAINDGALKELDQLAVQYFEMKDALVNDDFKKAKDVGMKFSAAIGKVDMKLFKGEAHHRWMAYSEKLSKSLEHIGHTQSIEEVRKIFLPVSEQMIGLAQSLMSGSGTMYVQHCPMADNNKGADWLSLDSTVKNPYFGASMLTCGEVKMTLN